MLNNKQRLYFVLEAINEKLVLIPNDSPIYIDPKGDLKGYYPEQELIQIFQKLQDDEKVLKVVKWPLEYKEEVEDTYFGLSVEPPTYQEYLTKIQQEPEYKNFK